MTYPKFGATFFDLGLQLPRQILTKSKKFQNSKIFMENSKSFIKEEFPPKNILLVQIESNYLNSHQSTFYKVESPHRIAGKQIDILSTQLLQIQILRSH